MPIQPPPKKNKLNARRRCASISFSPLHTQRVQTLTININHHTQKCKTNPITYAHGMPCPKYAKRTQFPTPPPCWPPQIMQNEPNLHPANSQSPTAKSCFCETNPICPTPTVPPPPISAKRTQLSVRAWHAVPQMRKTNPICPHGHPALRQKCETNPIYRPTTPLSAIYYLLTTILRTIC